MANNPLDPKVLAKVRSLELQARQVVEGYLSGMHRSPQHGFAVEFAQHREYAPGDDIRHVDWKVYGRTERYYLKQYQLETNLVGWLMVDASESMKYGSGEITKYDYAVQAAATLGYLITHQSDSFGLARFDSQIRQFLRASGTPGHLRDALQILSAGPTDSSSRMGAILHEACERFNRRGIVMIFSDFFDEVPEILTGLKHLRYQKQDVIVFHVLDPAEIEFPFRQSTLFRGLEQQPELLTDPVGIRESYLAEFQAFQRELEQGCRFQNIDYVLLRTDQNLGQVLAGYLSQRASRTVLN